MEHVERARHHEYAASKEWKAKEEGLPAVDGGGTLRGMIEQRWRIAGTAARHLLAHLLGGRVESGWHGDLLIPM